MTVNNDAASAAAAAFHFRWVQAECRSLGENDAPEVDPTLTAAVAALRDRPVLFKYCAEEVRLKGWCMRSVSVLLLAVPM